jgi:hypothetical protein
MYEAAGAFIEGNEYGLRMCPRPQRLGINVFNCREEMVSKGSACLRSDQGTHARDANILRR